MKNYKELVLSAVVLVIAAILIIAAVMMVSVQIIPVGAMVHDCIVESCSDGKISLFDYWNNYRLLPYQ